MHHFVDVFLDLVSLLFDLSEDSQLLLRPGAFHRVQLLQVRRLLLDMIGNLFEVMLDRIDFGLGKCLAHFTLCDVPFGLIQLLEVIFLQVSICLLQRIELFCD